MYNTYIKYNNEKLNVTRADTLTLTFDYRFLVHSMALCNLFIIQTFVTKARSRLWMMLDKGWVVDYFCPLRWWGSLGASRRGSVLGSGFTFNKSILLQASVVCVTSCYLFILHVFTRLHRCSVSCMRSTVVEVCACISYCMPSLCPPFSSFFYAIISPHTDVSFPYWRVFAVNMVLKWSLPTRTTSPERAQLPLVT